MFFFLPIATQEMMVPRIREDDAGWDDTIAWGWGAIQKKRPRNNSGVTKEKRYVLC